MPKFIFHTKSEKEAEMARALLRFFRIEFSEEKEEAPRTAISLQEFYGQFQMDVTGFRFDREEANKRSDQSI